MTDLADMLEDVRDWVGSTPADEDVEAIITAFDGEEHQVERAALRILRRRRADENYTSFAVDGDVSWSKAGWLADLDRRILDLRNRIGGTETASTLPTVQAAEFAGPGNAR